MNSLLCQDRVVGSDHIAIGMVGVRAIKVKAIDLEGLCHCHERELVHLDRLIEEWVGLCYAEHYVSLLAHMAKYAGLPWDCILSAELARHYKPDAEAYLKAIELLSCAPSEVMMVAAHQGDLRHAAQVGMKTAFVLRPLERGPDGKKDLTPDPDFDIVARDFHDLADKLGCY